MALAEIGALNSITGRPEGHRRDALWQVERAARRPGPLLESAAFETISQVDFVGRGFSRDIADLSRLGALAPETQTSPLAPMTNEERLIADFRGTGMTVGPHPMAYHRAEMKRRGIRSAIELGGLPDESYVRVAGAVIARQRPGTAKGFVFLSLEDETGIANAIITPQLFEREYLTVVREPFLVIEGRLQNQDNAISVKAQRVRPLSITRAETASHDFH